MNSVNPVRKFVALALVVIGLSYFLGMVIGHQIKLEQLNKKLEQIESKR